MTGAAPATGTRQERLATCLFMNKLRECRDRVGGG